MTSRSILLRILPYSAVSLSAAVGLGLGCSGRSLKSMDLGGGLPTDIAADLREKYEVKEDTLPAVEASPVAMVSPTPVETPKKGATKAKKSKKDAKTEPTAEKAKLAYPSRRPAVEPFAIGEKQTWEVTYFGMSAGDVSFQVMPFKQINSRKVYHFQGRAVSSSVFSLFYRLDDMVESFMDYEGRFSHRFHVKLDETKQQRDALEINDSERGQTFYWNRWQHYQRGYSETKDFSPAPPFAQDSMSAMYYIRGLPLSVGQVIEFPVISEGNHWDCVVTVVRKETIDSPLGRVSTFVLKPEHKLKGILQKKGDSFMWITDDAKRVVIRLEAKVKIGTVVAALKRYEPGDGGVASAELPDVSFPLARRPAENLGGGAR